MFATDIKSHRWRLLRKSGGGLINHRGLLVFDTAVYVATVIDALVLYDRGLPNCVYMDCGRDDGFTWDSHDAKSQRQVIIARFKGAGRPSCQQDLPKFFKDKGLAVSTISIPADSATAYFKQHTLEDFKQLLQRGEKRLKQSSANRRKDEAHFERTSEGFTCTVGEQRKYEIKGIEQKATQLKVTIKAFLKEGGSTPFELSTVDMYSYRARMWFARLCADLFSVSEDIIQADLHGILDFAENLQPSQCGRSVELTAAERQEAMTFLKNSLLMDRILDDFEAIGVVGERTNKLVGYLAAVSRKLDEPLSVLIQSRSAAGKSTLQDGILSLLPPEDVLKYTRITDQALFYSGENTFVHKVLAIEEGPGMKGAAYSIRNIQSAGKITIAATGKIRRAQGFKTSHYTVKGPVAVMLTTTATALDEETASRFIVLTIDESASMTQAIHDHHRRREGLNGVIANNAIREIFRRHHNAQRLLTPRLVVNPFAVHLSYPSNRLKARRDFKKYLGLIKAVAFLHQYQRELKAALIDGQNCEYIEVALSDIEQANMLATEVLGQSLDDLPTSSRQLLKLIHEMVTALARERRLPVARISITRRMIREYTGWSNWQVRNYLPPLLDCEYLVVQPHSRVNRYSFAINTDENSQEIHWTGLQLTPAADLRRKLNGGPPNGKTGLHAAPAVLQKKGK